MNRRLKTMTALAAGAVIVLSVVAWSNEGGWKMFEKRDGVHFMQDGVLTQIPGRNEKESLLKAIETGIDGSQATTPPALPINEAGLDRVEIKTLIGGNEETFLFDVTYEEDRPILLTNNDKPYNFTAIPNSKNTLMTLYGNIYVVDVEKREITKLLLDSVGEYEIDKTAKLIAEKRVDNLALVWGDHPSISPDGSKMIFYTNRNAAFEEQYNGEYWIKDLVTGEETNLVKGAFSILGWGEKEIYLSSFEKIYKVDLLTKALTEITNFTTIAAVQYPFLIVQSEPKAVRILHLKTREEKVVRSDSIEFINYVRIKEGNKWVLINYSPDIYNNGSVFAAIELETAKLRILETQEGLSYNDAQWVSDDQILVNTHRYSDRKEETYYIDIDQFKEVIE